MSIYYTDQIRITPVTTDENFRSETRGTARLSKAYVEEDDIIIYDSSGQPMKASKKIFTPYDTVISEGDMILITKKFGKDVSGERESKVISVNRRGSFKGDHLEILV